MLPLVLALSMQKPNDLYSETLRPQFHFTAQKGWINDPNGLVYAKGEYHLFFQHDPNDVNGAHKFWGHAVSKDLVHWKELPEAIEPDALGDIWSGSAVVDPLDTAHLGKGALICMYTAAGGTNDESKGQPFTQCLSYSLDGRTFTKFVGNPVLGHLEGGNRDPKLNWYEPKKEWVLALYLDGNRYGLFSSQNLRSWTQLQTVDMPNASECPDFFEVPLDGDKKKMKWVFWGASGYYRVGSFDGTTFKPETDSIRSDYGNTAYAAQTFYSEPKGRRVQITWLNGSVFPGCAWNQQLGFPTEMKLVSTPQGPRLTFEPVDKIKILRKAKIEADSNGNYAAKSGLIDIEGRFNTASSFSLSVNGTAITYDAAKDTLQALGKEVAGISGLQAGTRINDSRHVELRILADRVSIEIYAQHGLVNMPLYVLPTSNERGVRVTGSAERLDVYELKSAW